MKKLLSSILFLCCTTALAGPARPVTSGSFSAQASCGPVWDPTALQGQWFMDPASGATNVNAWEYCDDTNSLTIAGIAANISFSKPGDTNSNIIAFDIVATVRNNLPAEYDYVLNATNSHGETLQQPAGAGTHTMADTRITAEFAIADTNMIPAGSPPYWPDPVSGGSYHIEAVNEDLRAWYCWTPKSEQLPAGQFQVPAWNLVPSTIPPGGSAQVTMSFQVTGSGLPISDYRHSVIRASAANGWDVLYNRHPSLKISHWLDTLLIDSGYNFASTPPPPWWEEKPVEYVYASDASVFYNAEEPEESHKMHYPQLPNPDGWDVRACFSQEDGKQKVLADDFRCTASGPITNITFWGSWFFDEFLFDDPFQGIQNIHLSIHDDIPAGEVEEWSMPNLPALKEWNIDPNNPPQGWVVTITPEEPSLQGWYDPNTGLFIEQNHTNYFRYDITIPEEDAFIQVSNTIYWLDVSVHVAPGPQGETYLWGWKTTTNHWNDDAVWADLPVTKLSQWTELYEPPYFEQSLDLAFLIDGPAEQPPEEYDWGDAPDQPYPTLAANNGAYHAIPGGVSSALRLGALIDAEPDGLQDPNAMGDDTNNTDDEDGVSFPFGNTLYPGTVASPVVNAGFGGSGLTGSAYLQGWVDFNADGDWNDAGEQIYTDKLLTVPCNVVLPFAVPTNTVAGPANTFARIRISTISGLGPTGSATDGEVEDYEVTIAEAVPADWGDAPGSHYTLAAVNGAHHLTQGGWLGTSRDAEADGQPTAAADGDDAAGLDDEDGVIFTSPIQPGGYASVDVIASMPGKLDAWIDFDGAGGGWSFSEKIFSGKNLNAGINHLSFPVALSATNTAGGTTYARFRFSSSGGLGYSKLALDGEVEDYQVSIAETEPGQLDWGDAPDPPYQTYAPGAAHSIQPGCQLGSTVDAEPSAQANSTATGDDILGYADEDGIVFTSKLISGTNATVDITAGISGGMIDAWVDFNADGDWNDAGEQIFASQSVSAGLNNLNFAVPQPTALGQSFARFRLSSAGGLPPDNIGLVSTPEGEVEDYMVDLYQPAPTNLVITNIVVTLSNNLSKIEWASQPNIAYQAQSTTNLVTSNSWTDVGGWVIRNWQTNSAAPTSQFYRVTAPWSP